MAKLATSWKLYIVFLAFLEILSFFLIEYSIDPIASIIAIHTIPIVGIIIIIIFGRIK